MNDSTSVHIIQVVGANSYFNLSPSASQNVKNCNGTWIDSSGVTNSVIIGGSGLTGTTNNTVYTPDIEIVDFNKGVILRSPDNTTYVNALNIKTPFTPSSSGDTSGQVGDIVWDNNYVYIKTNTGWGRSALSYAF